MSIYATTLMIGDEHKPKCARLRKLGPKLYEQDDSMPCTCGDAPIVYRGSTVLPSDGDERNGSLDLGAIPGHISREGRPALSDDFSPWHPWLRVSIDATEGTVVLTRKQVVLLRRELTRWLRLASLAGGNPAQPPKEQS